MTLNPNLRSFEPCPKMVIPDTDTAPLGKEERERKRERERSKLWLTAYGRWREL